MKTTAIIAEYNPLHNGHLMHVQTARRETACDTLVVVMSGSFTQRGDLVFADKRQRAQWAIEAGADIVIELPTVYTLSVAERFAYGALRTLSPLGDFMLSFGSECGDVEKLSACSDYLRLENTELSESIKRRLAEGFSLAKSRELALNELGTDYAQIATSPNNILGIEYIKAARKLSLSVDFHTLTRVYDDDAHNLTSSTAVRKLALGGADYSKFVPDFVRFSAPDLDKYQALALYAINNATAAELENISTVSEGMNYRIKKRNYTSLAELMAMTSRRYTKATMKRIIACITLAVTKPLAAYADQTAPYVSVLALRDGRKDLLSLIGKATPNLFLKPTDCESDNPCYPLVALDNKADMLYNLCK